MKKYSVRISVLSIVLSVMFLVIPTGTKAKMKGRHKKDLVAELNVKSSGLLGPGSHSIRGEKTKGNPSRELLIPLKEGLTVFIDCASPRHQATLTPKDARKNYRTVIGFHVSLR